MTHRSALFGLAALALALGAGTAHASAVLVDTTFDLDNYQPTKVFSSNAASSFTATQCAACGHPDEALSLSLSLPNGGALTLGFINDALVYDPATQGAIDGLSASVSKDLTTIIPGPQGNTFRPLILQGGTYYMAVLNGATVTGPTTTGFRDISGALTAASFSKYDFATGVLGGGNPNFTAGEMRFGLAQFSAGVPAGTTTGIRYDNLAFGITSTPPVAPVPEPASWTIMILGFGAAGAVLRRRRRALAAV